MPWHLPADLKHFKQTTMGKPIVMGRKTFESIGRPLPGRRNVVITRNGPLAVEGVECFSSIDKALDALSDHEEIMITGGAQIYQQLLALADHLYLTLIDLETEGDTFFPAYEHLNLKLISQVTGNADDNNPHEYRFIHYQVEH